MHRILVQVDGWQQVQYPIAVDRVGTFVYQMNPGLVELPRTRLVVDITVVGGRKVVSLRSGLILQNRLTVPLEFRLETAEGVTLVLPHVLPGDDIAVPLDKTSCLVRMRPLSWGCQWSVTGIAWERLGLKNNQRVGMALECRAIGPADHDLVSRFRCCASVLREGYPLVDFAAPSHTITVVPPLVIANLLPVEARFAVGRLTGELGPGGSVALYEADLQRELRLELSISGFAASDPALINGRSAKSKTDDTVRLRDYDGRLLHLCIENMLSSGFEGARTVSFYAPFWMLNLTGLPLLYKQVLRSKPAAGLRLENEHLLRSKNPFLFSCDGEDLSSGNKCCVAINQVSEKVKKKREG